MLHYWLYSSVCMTAAPHGSWSSMAAASKLVMAALLLDWYAVSIIDEMNKRTLTQEKRVMVDEPMATHGGRIHGNPRQIGLGRTGYKLIWNGLGWGKKIIK